ncbi:MAG TPA: type II toxin-antitoxin system VapC family toxin [Verrucomicrobiae bacterium]|jgi:predicted nucleic acid-binding protein
MSVKNYWDASALIESAANLELRERLAGEGGYTRPHTLAEIFSTLTGGKIGFQMDANVAAAVIASLAADLDFIDLTAAEILKTFAQARAKGVRGGRVHDYLHAVAAKKAGATVLLTTDKFDFDGLFEPVNFV